MSVTLKKVESKADIKQFVRLPFEIYKDNKYWVPPIIKDEIKALDPLHNPAFSFCDAVFYLAYKNGKCVGRIGAIINKKYNEKTGEQYVRFAKLEFFDDVEVVDTLIHAAEDFGRKNGMKKVHGPLGFTNLDTQGMLVEGFDYLPSVASVYHLPYYRKHLERLGYQKENDWIEFELKLGEHAVKKAKRGADLVGKRYGFKVVTFNDRKQMQPYVKKIFSVLNEGFAKLPYVVAFDERTKTLYAEKYIKILNPRYVFVVEKENEPIGFLVALPNLSKAMQKVRGKLFPFGFTHILKALKHPRVIDLLLVGVLPQYEKTGAVVTLFAELQHTMLQNNIDTMETTGIFETNQAVIAHWKNYDHIQHKRRRCFVKNL